MKKLFDKTVGGYYVMSVVLGLLLAFAVGEIVEVAVLYMPYTKVSDLEGAEYFIDLMARTDFWDSIWACLPLRLCMRFAHSDYQNLAMIGATFAAVALFVMMSGGGHWRSKVLQTMGVTLLALLVLTAVAMATTSVLVTPLWALLPVVLAVIPLVILKKAQESNGGAGKKCLGYRLGFVAGYLYEKVVNLWERVREFANEHPGPTIVAGIMTLFCVAHGVVALAIDGNVARGVFCIVANVVCIFLVVKLYGKKEITK